MTQCRELVGAGERCPRDAKEVRLRCPEGRPEAVAAYCDEHGGEARARAEAERDWNYVAPAGVGDAEAVEHAGCLCLGTPEAYIVARHTSEVTGGVWLAWLGLGSRLTPVVNPEPAVKLRANGQPRKRGGKRPRGDGTKSFPSREAALRQAKVAWAEGVERRVTEIREARGGTLAWGAPVEPLEEPIVIVLEQGDSRSAWDIAPQLARQSRQGVGVITGLRPSGEAL